MTSMFFCLFFFNYYFYPVDVCQIIQIHYIFLLSLSWQSNISGYVRLLTDGSLVCTVHRTVVGDRNNITHFLTKQHTCIAADTQRQQSRQSGRMQATVAECAASSA